MAFKVDPDTWYNPDEAATLLGCRTKTLEADRTKGGGVRYTKLGRRIFYKGADLIARLEAGARSSTASRPGPAPARLHPANVERQP